MSASSDCYACVKKTTICSIHDEAVEDDHLSRCCSTWLSHEQFLNGKDCQCGKSLFEDENVTFWCVGCEEKKTTEDTSVNICDTCESEYCESCVLENGDGGVLCEKCRDAYTDGIPSEPEVSNEATSERNTAVFSCSIKCECENNSLNWNTCSSCAKQTCDFSHAYEGDWTYNDEEETWLCPTCSDEESDEESDE